MDNIAEYLNKKLLALQAAMDSVVEAKNARTILAYYLPDPSVGAGPDDQILFCWDQGRHHLELEFVPGEETEFFYRDRETDEYWSEAYTSTEIPLKVKEVIPYFVKS